MSSSIASKTGRVAVIDVGSNTIKLLVASRKPEGALITERFQVEETRIGEGLSGRPPVIDSDAIERGVAAICRLTNAAADSDALCIVATSAAREASNKEEFINAVEKACGHQLFILSGEEESRLIGLGLRQDPKIADLRSYTLLDLGGGSLECVRFVEGKCALAGSLPLGSVRLASMLIENRLAPLAALDQQRIAAYVEEHWLGSDFVQGRQSAPVAVLTGGAASVIGDLLSAEKRERGLSLREFLALKESICSRTFDQRVSELGIPESRADILPTAAATLDATLRFHDCERIRFSRFNLRYGVAATLLSQGMLRPQ